MTNTNNKPIDKSLRCAVVAGGTSGVGLAAAHRFADTGWGRVVILGRDESRGKSAEEQLVAATPEADIAFIPVDLLDPRSTAEVFDRIRSEHGRIDALVTATHGGSTPTLLGDIALEQIKNLLSNQVVSVFHACRAVLPVMQEQGSGSIITISSDAAKVPTPGETIVGAAMSAIMMFSKTLAIEAKRHGIRVNSILPSVVTGTESFERVLQDPFAQKVFGKIDRMAALGLPDPDDLASLIIFLASEESARITGQAISINGGISAV